MLNPHYTIQLMGKHLFPTILKGNLKLSQVLKARGKSILGRNFPHQKTWHFVFVEQPLL